MLYLEVYPDVVFLVNFFIDLVLIFLVKKVNKKVSSRKRTILAAAIGGISAAIMSIFPWMNSFIKFLLMYIATSLLMIFIAFGKLKLLDALKQWVVLNLVTYFVGGFMNSIYYHTNFRMLLISIGDKNIFSNLSSLNIIILISVSSLVILTLLWFLRQYHNYRPLVYDVELVLEDRHIRTKGLMDTGNCLYDPIQGKPVMIIENSLIDQLLSTKIKQDMELALSYMDGKSDETPYPKNNKFRFTFIPYRSIGKTGMLLAIRLDKVMIHTENESICNERVTAAICDNRLTGSREGYHVILHKELL